MAQKYRHHSHRKSRKKIMYTILYYLLIVILLMGLAVIYRSHSTQKKERSISREELQDSESQEELDELLKSGSHSSKSK